MVEKKVQKTKAQSDYLSDSKSSEDEVNLYLCTSQEERVYGTIKGSTQPNYCHGKTSQHCIRLR